jgi:hypothetical protein
MNVELLENTTISKMEKVVKQCFNKYFKVVEFNHFKPLEFEGLRK